MLFLTVHINLILLSLSKDHFDSEIRKKFCVIFNESIFTKQKLTLLIIIVLIRRDISVCKKVS